MAIPQIMLIDGPSGCGKTTLANELAVKYGKQLVHMDDVYPGWSGLKAGTEIITDLVFGTERPHFYQWDWEHDRLGQRCEVDTSRLIIEGVGALSANIVTATRERAVGGLLQLSEPVRKQRALSRDPSFAPYWDMWAQQEATHFATLEQLAGKIPLLELDMTGLRSGEGVEIVVSWLAELNKNK